ncbi:hypothetical protein HZA71_01940, partial [Candidatus Falkowbacteria bacterium]|nr:hypothetical protein [Candidatus Falkowbacteria bacterium]
DNYDLFNQALKLSPNRPQVYYEMGYTQLYQGAYYQEKGDLQLSQGFYKDVINHFKKVLELSPRVVEANTTYVMALINIGEAGLAKQHLDLMDKNNINYHSEIYLNQLADSAVYFKDYDLVKSFYSELVSIYPDNPQYYMSLALAYAYLKDNEMAIQTAKDLLKLGSQYKDSVDSFIREVNAGKFKIQE